MRATYGLAAAAQGLSSVDEGLTFTEVLSNLPRDPASIFTFVLLLVTFSGIFWVGRPRRRTDSDETPRAGEDPRP